MILPQLAIGVVTGVSLLGAPLAAQEPLVQLTRGDVRESRQTAVPAFGADQRQAMAWRARDAMRTQTVPAAARRCSRTKRTVIGLAIGAVVAAPLAWAIDRRLDNEGSSSGDYVALVIAGGAGAGALVGWATCQ